MEVQPIRSIQTFLRFVLMWAPGESCPGCSGLRIVGQTGPGQTVVVGSDPDPAAVRPAWCALLMETSWVRVARATFYNGSRNASPAAHMGGSHTGLGVALRSGHLRAPAGGCFSPPRACAGSRGPGSSPGLPLDGLGEALTRGGQTEA